MVDKSFVAHAKLISGLTLLSRLLGVARESVSANYFGAGIVSSAFTVAFAIPNLFRKLFGEGALSAAFIPLYAQHLKQQKEIGQDASDFAAASVNLLCAMLAAITVLGEVMIWGAVWLWPDLRSDWLLTLKFTGIMLPYVLLICGTAFLSSILQVHRRFGPPAFAPVVLNLTHIGVMAIGARLLWLNPRFAGDAQLIAKQTALAYWLSGFVLVAGILQVMVLLPALRDVGFRLRWVRHFWTPLVKRMLLMTVPVALGAGVLQLSVLMDKGISLLLAEGIGRDGKLIRQFEVLGQVIRLPMHLGAAARLNWAQFLYQFPLGVFAIALATAIFPSLSADALDRDRTRFKEVMRLGIEATLFEGIAATLGLIIVRYPAVQLLFQHGDVTALDTQLIARSLLFYASAIWAFSLLQIINRAYYALHDTRTPLVMSIVNIVINLVVELPLIWNPWLGESAMAVGTCVSFAVQAVIMLWMLDRRIGGMELRRIAPAVLKMLLAGGLMVLACWGVRASPIYPGGSGKWVWAAQLMLLISVGAGVYLITCALTGVSVLEHLLPKRLLRKNR